MRERLRVDQAVRSDALVASALRCIRRWRWIADAAAMTDPVDHAVDEPRGLLAVPGEHPVEMGARHPELLHEKCQIEVRAV